MGIGSEELYKVIFSGVDIGRFSGIRGDGIRGETGWGGKIIVGWAGRLVPIKDCGTFIRAASILHGRYPDIRFLIAGDGSEREGLERLSNELGLNDSLVFLGNRTDIEEVMAAMDVFVLSSLNEGFGRVIVEAMASGAAVVSTDVGGTADIVVDGVTGLLVPSGEPETMADAVGRLIGDDVLRRRFADAGRARAREYDIRVMVSKFEELYEDLCNR